MQLDLSIPYILVKEKAAQAHRYNADGSVMKKDGATVMLPTSEEHPWGYGSAIENFGFSGKTFDGWEKTVTEGTKEQITIDTTITGTKGDSGIGKNIFILGMDNGRGNAFSEINCESRKRS